MENYSESSELYHHGILGMKWGVRRYQNPDGSLTELGREHYGVGKRAKRAVEKIADGVHDYRVKRAIKTGKNLEVLSDDELRNALNRRNTEVSYKRNMEYLYPKKVSKGRQIIADTLERTARGALYKLSDKLIGNMFKDSDDEAAEELARERVQEALYEIERKRKTRAQDEELANLTRDYAVKTAKEKLDSYDYDKSVRDYERFMSAIDRQDDAENYAAKRAIKRNNVFKEFAASVASAENVEQTMRDRETTSKAFEQVQRQMWNDFAEAYSTAKDGDERNAAVKSWSTMQATMTALRNQFTPGGPGKK